jgi:DNA-binding FadR family transcriptional regulator
MNKNAHGQSLDRLGRDIVAGIFAPGSAVPPEPLLGDALGVSRTVVREAIKSLVAKGMVSTGPKVGTRVLPANEWNWFDPDVVAWQSHAGISKEFLRDLQELRRIVEPAAARLAAQRATAGDLQAIEDAYLGMKSAIENGGDYVGHDLAFHQRLIAASHNRMVVQMSKALGALLRTSFEVSSSKMDAVMASLPLHCALLDAVKARNSTKAERAAQILIDSANADIEAVLATRRKLPSVVAPARLLSAGVRLGARKAKTA